MTPTEILILANQTDAIPVDLRRICSVLGVSVIPKDFSEMGLSNANAKSLYVRNAENIAIFYDSALREDTAIVWLEVAKQLAFFMKFKSLIHVGNAGMNDGEFYDFVVDLLIPDGSIKKIIGKLVIPDVSTIAKVFDVPVELVKYKLHKMRWNRDVVGYNVSDMNAYVMKHLFDY